MLKLLAQIQPEEFGFLGNSAMILVILSLFFIFLFLAFFLWLGWWITNRHGKPCPYTGLPLKKGSDLVFSVVQEIHDYMVGLHDPENPPFDLRKAAICPKTGKIFPDSLTLFGVIKVNWNFLKKRYPGQWISWGSLNSEQKKQISIYHCFLEGFQTEHSPPQADPKDIDPQHAEQKPGPLYVDVATRTLLGWKCIPGTNWEVLILKTPLPDPNTVYDDVVRAKKSKVE